MTRICSLTTQPTRDRGTRTGPPARSPRLRPPRG
jgi:hypothetical protein